MELKYPKNASSDWHVEMMEFFKKSPFEIAGGKDKEIHFFVKDINLRYSVEEYLESLNIPTEYYSLNRKVIILRKRAFCALFFECCSESDQKKILKQLEEDNNELMGNKVMNAFDGRECLSKGKISLALLRIIAEISKGAGSSLLATLVMQLWR